MIYIPTGLHAIAHRCFSMNAEAKSLHLMVDTYTWTYIYWPVIGATPTLPSVGFDQWTSIPSIPTADPHAEMGALTAFRDNRIKDKCVGWKRIHINPCSTPRLYPPFLCKKLS